MKKIIVLFVYLVLVIGSKQAMNAQYLGCTISECTEEWSSSSVNVEVPGYPGCVVTVVFNYRMCLGFTEIQLDHIRLHTTSICDDLFDDLFPFGFFLGVDEQVSRSVWQSLYHTIMEQLFMTAYNALPPQFKHTLECPNGQAHFHMMEGSCTSLCLNYYLNSPSDPEENYWTIRYNRCKENTCCVWITGICYDTTQEKPVRTTLGPWEYNNAGTPPCNTIAKPACNGGFYNYSGDCTDQCHND